jgi:hypothetical protein
MSMRPVVLLVVLVLGAATAVLVACGGDGRLPSSDASSLTSALDEVSADFRAGRCGDAERALARARSVLGTLPSTVDPALRSRLGQGIDNLAQRVPASCRAATTQSQPTETTTTDTTTTDTTTTGTDTTGTDTTPTDTTPTDTTTTPTDTGTTPTTDTTPPAPGDGSGGTPPADGGTG